MCSTARSICFAQHLGCPSSCICTAMHSMLFHANNRGLHVNTPTTTHALSCCIRTLVRWWSCDHISADVTTYSHISMREMWIADTFDVIHVNLIVTRMQYVALATFQCLFETHYVCIPATCYVLQHHIPYHHEVDMMFGDVVNWLLLVLDVT